jgi:peptide subunit release factor 1 (eRF1)
MIGERDIQELAAYEPGETPVVSLYLNVDPTQRTTDAYKLRMRGLLKNADRPELAEDLAAIEKYIEHQYDWSGRGVVLFSNQSEDLWKAFPIAVPLSSSRLEIGRRPFIRPLVHLLDTYGNYGVVLVDRQGARLYHIHMGQLLDSTGYLGEEIRRLKKGGGSSRGGAVASRSGGRGGSQREREIATQNLRDVMEITTAFFEEKKPKHLLLAGTEETVAQFRDMLPKHLTDAVVGTLTMDMTAKDNEVLERSLEIVRQADKEREAKLVKTAITAAAKGSNGVIRLDDTLGAVSEGRVQTLIVSDGFHAPGYRCKSCTYLTGQTLSACPFCGGEIREIPDAVELAIQRVTEQGGEVEIIEDKEKLDAAGGIGALLRY